MLALYVSKSSKNSPFVSSNCRKLSASIKVIYFSNLIMRFDKQRTRDFYDSFGWQRANEKTFNDSAVFVDDRPVLDFYKGKVFDRVSKDLKQEGKYFLDAGSGALPNLNRASRFEHLICVDVSLVGLIEAQKKLGTKGCCVVADLAQLPFRGDVFDAILCSHALYHIPKDDQATAVAEMYRTLHAGERCVILYNRSGSPLETLAARLDGRGFFAKARQMISLLTNRSWARNAAGNRSRSDRDEITAPSSIALYFHGYGPEWFITHAPRGASLRIEPWESAGPTFTRNLVPNSPIGSALLFLVLLFEKLCPRVMSRLGAYFYIVVRKP